MRNWKVVVIMYEKWVARMCLEGEVTLHFSYAFLTDEGNKVRPKV
jgi:hypothetical protein